MSKIDVKNKNSESISSGLKTPAAANRLVNCFLCIRESFYCDVDETWKDYQDCCAVCLGLLTTKQAGQLFDLVKIQIENNIASSKNLPFDESPLGFRIIEDKRPETSVWILTTQYSRDEDFGLRESYLLYRSDSADYEKNEMRLKELDIHFRSSGQLLASLGSIKQKNLDAGTQNEMLAKILNMAENLNLAQDIGAQVVSRKRGRPRKGEKSTNEKLAHYLAKYPSDEGRPASFFAEMFGCSESAVKATAKWKSIIHRGGQARVAKRKTKGVTDDFLGQSKGCFADE